MATCWVLLPKSLLFSQGATALHLAIAYGNDEIAQEIVKSCNEKAAKMLVTTIASGKLNSLSILL